MTEARVSSSMEKREEALLEMDESIALANEIFLVKTIRFDVILKVVEVCEVNNATPPLVTNVLMARKPVAMPSSLSPRRCFVGLL